LLAIWWPTKKKHCCDSLLANMQIPVHDLILFDLDGTISDPLEGMARSINYALRHFGYQPYPKAELAHYVGPPLDQTFSRLLNVDHSAHLNALVAKYRERYANIGYAENVLYEGIPDMLLWLHQSNIRLAVCTSKRRDFAVKILKMFGIDAYFEFVSGGDVGVEKWQQIASLKSQGLVTEQSLMVGDRAVDLIAAHRNGLSSAAVLWGYGGIEELDTENPLYVFSAPQSVSRQFGAIATH